jgi:hypothetical protein
MVASYRDDLAVVIAEAVQPAAVQVDRPGQFPRAAIQALTDAGPLGLVSVAEVGAEKACAPPPRWSTGSPARAVHRLVAGYRP